MKAVKCKHFIIMGHKRYIAVYGFKNHILAVGELIYPTNLTSVEDIDVNFISKEEVAFDNLKDINERLEKELISATGGNIIDTKASLYDENNGFSCVEKTFFRGLNSIFNRNATL